MRSRIKLTCYDSSFNRLGFLGDNLLSYDLTPQFLAAGAGTITLKRNDPKAAYATTEGNRFVLTYKGQDIWSGYFRDPSGSLLKTGAVSVPLVGDWKALPGTVGWIRPDKAAQAASLSDVAQATVLGALTAGTVTNQGGYYIWGTNTAETAIKQVLRDNLVSRLHRPFAIQADAGRGAGVPASVMPQLRNPTLEEVTAPLLGWSGLGLQLLQRTGDTAVNIETWLPKTWPETLTVESGIVTDGTWQLNYPTATRVLVGGPGEDAARAFKDVTTADSLAAETLYGDIVEVFRDATGFTMNWPDAVADANRVEKYFALRPEVAAADQAAFAQYMLSAGTDALADGAATSTVSASLSETRNFSMFGLGTDGTPAGRQLGDVVTIRSGDGDDALLFSAPITAAQLTQAADAAFKCVPTVGDAVKTNAGQLARMIRRQAAALRRIQAAR